MKFKPLLFFIFNFLFINVVYANDIKNINMDIYLDNNGNAHIKEKWVVNVTSGTEIYRTYKNAGPSTITDYKVYLNNQEFTTIQDWNEKASFSEKSYKAGLNIIKVAGVPKEYELCFGISEYGLNTYELDYTITNFVIEATDSDVVYWNLIPEDLDNKPENFYIKIYSDFKYVNSDIWAYGSYGDMAYVYDGYMEIENSNALDYDEYVTVLIRFPKETFNNEVKTDFNFNYYYNKAEQSSVHYEKEEENKTTYSITYILKVCLRNILLCILGLLVGAIIFSPISLVLIRHDLATKIKYGTKKIKFRKGVNKVKNAPYFRDIPYDNIFEGYWVSCQFDLVKNKTDFLGVMLLKWLKDKNIEIIKDKKIKIKFNNDNNLSKDEKELYDMLKAASKDNILKENEFSDWCYKNYYKVIDWFDDIFDKTTAKFYQKGKLTKVIEKVPFGKLFNDPKEQVVYYVEEIMKNDGLKVAGLKNFLNDFSNIKDRMAIEIIHWEEYLMYAQMFGIAEKVAKEFKDLYPETIIDITYDDIVAASNFSYVGISSINRSKSSGSSSSSSLSKDRSHERADRYSSGGGGYSSKGGGKDAFGSGSKGGFR